MCSKEKQKVSVHLVGCHQLPERSFFYKGKQFPVCARCTGTWLGYLTVPLFLFNIVHLSWLITFILFIPNALDGLTQALQWRESNNYLRLILGFASGFAFMSLLSLIGKGIGFFLVSLFL